MSADYRVHPSSAAFGTAAEIVAFPFLLTGMQSDRTKSDRPKTVASLRQFLSLMMTLYNSQPSHTDRTCHIPSVPDGEPRHLHGAVSISARTSLRNRGCVA